MNATPTPTTCSACGANAFTDGVCGRCGNVSGDANKCPHCGSIARVEPKGSGASLRWVCGVCAGPRMPAGLGGEAAASPLREAKASLTRATRFRLSYRVFVVAAVLAGLSMVMASFISSGLMLALMGFATTIQTWLALRQRSRAKSATADANEALDRAWLAAAEDVTSHAKKGVTVAELATRLKIDAVKAEQLLTQLAVHDRTRIDVDDDAEVRYSITPEVDTSKVRVASSGVAGAGDTPSEDQFRALEEAEAHAAESNEAVAQPARQMTAEEESNDPTRVPFPSGKSR